MADNFTPEDFKTDSEPKGLSIDYKRVLSRAMRFWYVIVLCLGIAVLAAAFHIRYSIRIYPVSTSIIIRETEETSGAELLYKNALIDPYRNYLNEPYIIRSYPLIQSVMEDLDFGTVFYKEGNLLTSELYGIPIKVRLGYRKSAFGASLQFKLVDENNFILQVVGAELKSGEKFHFNDSIIFNGLHLYFELEKGKDYRSYLNAPLILSISDPAWITGSYVGRLGALWAEEGSGVINLSLNGSYPEKEIDFLNGLIKNYQRYDLNKKNRTADRTIRFIKGQLYHIADSLGFSEVQLEKFKTKKDGVEMNLDDESKRVYVKISDIENQQMELVLRGKYYTYLDDYIKRNENLDQVVLPSALGVSDQLMVQLVTKLTDLQSEVNLYKNADNASNPFVTLKQAKIAEIRREITESIKSLRAADQIKSEFLGIRYTAVNNQLHSLPFKQRQMISLERNYHLLENLYIFLNQKMAEAEISMASNISDIIVVNPPMLTGGPITPKPFQAYLIAILAGLALPVALFVLLELLDNKIQSKEDIEKLTRIPLIGAVGHTKDSSNLIVYNKPKSSVAESFRALRSNLSYFTNSEEKKIFMITSSISGEGKTFTTANLATIIALSDKKVLVIGADMRKPKLFNDFGVGNAVGLSTLLSGKASFPEVVQHTNVKNIDLISGGPVPPNPAELLMLPIVDDFLKEALKMYDYVLLDTPPIGIVSDALMLTKFADHVVFVTRQNYTPKHFLSIIQDYYETGRVKNISILLNDISKTGPGYGYGGYGYSYGYGYGYSYGYGTGKKKNGYGYYTES